MVEHFFPTRISGCQLSLHGFIIFDIFVLYLLPAFIFWGSLTVFKLKPFQGDAFAILPPQASSRSRSKDLARKEVKKFPFDKYPYLPTTQRAWKDISPLVLA